MTIRYLEVINLSARPIDITERMASRLLRLPQPVRIIFYQGPGEGA